MKNLIKIVVAIAFFPFMTWADHLSEKFTVACTIELIGGPNSSSIKDQSVSEPRAAHEQAMVSFDLGNYVLRALSVAKIPQGKSFDDAIPDLQVTLLKKGAGVASHINYMTTPVVVDVGQSHSLSSFNFLQLNYKGQTYSRIDYTCTMTRVE